MGQRAQDAGELMPRLEGYVERRQHDFAWNVHVDANRAVELFTEGDFVPPPWVTCTRVERSSVMFDNEMIVIDTALSRSDVLLVLRTNGTDTAFSGPWMQRNAIALHDLYSIYDDALKESKDGKRKKMDAIGILREVIEKSKYGGVYRPVYLRRQTPMAGYVRLLPNAPAGLVTVQIRVVVSVPLQ